MNCRLMFIFSLAVSQAVTLCSPLFAADAPQITLVISENAPPLEKLAASQLTEQFQKMWQAEVQIAGQSPADGTVILIGSPATNAAIKAAVGKEWPKLTDQGIVVKSVKGKNGIQLIVGGGSPVATLWAASELGHQFGIRYHLHGDVYPAAAPAFKLDGFNIVQEPNLRMRTWRTINDFPIGPEAWGLAEHKRVLQQLAKQKFNRVMLATYPWQPFNHYEFRGVKKEPGMLWFGYRYPIDGDTPGRSIFKGAKEFYNPDLAGKKEEITAAGIELLRGVIDESHRLGMTVGLSFSPLEFPKEFAKALPDAKVIHQLETLTVGPGAKQPPDDKLLAELATAQLRSYLDAYPKLDALYLTLPEFPAWDEHTDAAWKRLSARAGIDKKVQLKDLEQAAAKRKTLISGDRGVRAVRGNVTTLDFLQTWLDGTTLLRRHDGTTVELYVMEVDPMFYPYLDKVLPHNAGGVHLIDYTARRVAANLDIIKSLPKKNWHNVRSPADPSLIFTLADDNVGVLPQLATKHIETLVQSLRQSKWAGFSTRYWISADLDPTIHYLSRTSFDDKITPEMAYEDLVAPNAGGGSVAERLSLGWSLIARATDLIDEHDIGFAFPIPNMVMKHYAATEPPPKWWQEVSDHYLNAMNEMYRAHDAADPAGRKLLYRYARRYEFALEYMTAMQAVRSAGAARAKGDRETQLKKLEEAAEGLYNGLTALSTVAADDSGYQGVIAVLTEYGYRPLQKEIEKLEDSE